MRPRKKNKTSLKAFTLVELLVASAISALVLTIAYSLSREILTANKQDGTAIKLNAKIDNAIDFVIDEVNSSKRILNSTSGISSSCTIPTGEFVIGLTLPDQAKNLSSYTTAQGGTNNPNWAAINCPVIYSLQRDNTYKGRGGSYLLYRQGPDLDEKGYYNVTKPAQNVLITDGIRYQPGDTMSCPSGWGKPRTVRGIIICSDPWGKSAEIGISAESMRSPTQYSQVTKSSGAFSRIQDSQLIGDQGTSTIPISGGGQPCATPGSCCIFGTCTSSSKITYFIDVSGSMSWVRIKGKTAMEAAKTELIKNINALQNGVKLQVVAFNHYPRYAFNSGPQILDSNTRAQVIRFVSNLRAGGGTNPWNGLWQSMTSQDVSQVILMSDGWTSTSGTCNGRYQKYADCYKDYNDNVRSKTAAGTVQIDTISLGNNLCSGSGWMGELSSKNGGKCNVIN